MKRGEPRDEFEGAVSSLIERGLVEVDLDPSADSVGKLTELVLLLARWAKRINLTGHRDPLEMTQRLVLDAVALASVLPELKAAETLADLGSGAGFPGLPIAILHPGLKVHLVDSRLKRNHFQREARRQLGLGNVHPILGRSDRIEPVLCQVVVAQAMTQPEQALALMTDWAAPGAWIALPASEGTAPPPLSGDLEQLERREYRVPGTGTSRLLWVMRRKAD